MTLRIAMQFLWKSGDTQQQASAPSLWFRLKPE
jgi:hypothetical protein